MRICLVLFCVLLILACQDQKQRSASINEQTVDVSKHESSMPEDTSGFLANCNEILNHSMLGGLQGVDANRDSTSQIITSECFDYCNETFEILFVYRDFDKRKSINPNSLYQEFEAGCSNLFKDFDCFAFVYPMRDPDKQDDPHGLNFDLPVEMKIYERVSGDNWRFMKKAVAKSFEEWGQIRFNAIYHLY